MSDFLDNLKIVGQPSDNIWIQTGPNSNISSGYNYILEAQDNNGFLLGYNTVAGTDIRFVMDVTTAAGTLRIRNSADSNDKVRFTSVINGSSFINNGGNFGIGTASPTDNLQIGGTGGTGKMNLNGGNAFGATLSIRSATTTGMVVDVYSQNQDRSYFAISRTNSTDSVVGLNGGVYQAVNLNGTARNLFGSAYDGDAALISSRHNMVGAGTDALFNWTDTYNTIIIDSTKAVTETRPYILFQGGNGAAPTNTGEFRFHTIADSWVAVATLGSVGNFGVGTNGPLAKLHVHGSGNTSSTYSFMVENSSSTNYMRIRDDGRVEIGPTGTTRAITLEANGDILIGSGNGTYITLGTTSLNTVNTFRIRSGHFIYGENYAYVDFSRSSKQGGYGTKFNTIDLIGNGLSAYDFPMITFESKAVLSGTSPIIANSIYNDNGWMSFANGTIGVKNTEPGFTNSAADTANLRLRAGLATGSANGGYITFETSQGGVSGSSQNSAVERVRITATGEVQIIGLADNTSPAQTRTVLVEADGTLIAGVASGSAVDGTGTIDYLPKWVDSNTLTDSLVSDNGTTVTINGTNFIVTDRIDTINRILRYDATLITVDWADLKLFNSLGNKSVDWGSHALYYPNGTDVALTWDSNGFVRILGTSTVADMFGYGTGDFRIGGDPNGTAGNGIVLKAYNGSGGWRTGLEYKNVSSGNEPDLVLVPSQGSVIVGDLAGTADRIVEANTNGKLSATRTIITTYGVPNTEKLKLEDPLNWNVNGEYIGTAIVNTYQGQKHYDDNYFYEAVADNYFIRLIRG